MIVSSLLALLLAPAPAVSSSGAGLEYAQLMIRERVIVRVPTRHLAPQAAWKEKKGPRCMPMGVIAGAAVSAPDSVDFVLRGGSRVRAKLERDCPTLDYYSGFYLRPTADARICADRDAVHARSGGECGIARFRTLVPDE